MGLLNSVQAWVNTSHVIYGVRAKHRAEEMKHRRTRAEFLRCLLADSRTQDLFAFWEHQTGVGAVIADMIALLGAAAQQAGLPHRSALRRREFASNLAPILDRLQEHEARYERLLEETQSARWRFAMGWVVAELYGALVDEDVPIRGWLATDLLTIFRWHLAAAVYGEPIRLIVSSSPIVGAGALKKGLRAKPGDYVERNARWYYLTRVRVPRVTEAQLAEEYRAASGTALAPKDARGNRADTKLVRASIAESQRLLELPVPPEFWNHVHHLGATRGEKLH